VTREGARLRQASLCKYQAAVLTVDSCQIKKKLVTGWWLGICRVNEVRFTQNTTLAGCSGLAVPVGTRVTDKCRLGFSLDKPYGCKLTHFALFYRDDCPWSVQSSRDYRIYQDSASTDYLPKLTLLLQTDGSGHAGEGFRFVVSSSKITAIIWSRDILDNAELAGYQLRYELRGQDIEIRPNSLTSQWEDLDNLIGKGKIVVTGGSEEPLNSSFRQTWAAGKKKCPQLGAAIRWAVLATPRGDLKLNLQGLPGDAQVLRSEPYLSSDDTEAIQLDTFKTEVDWKDCAPGRGPVPVLFARDPDGVRSALSRNLERIYAGIVWYRMSANRKPLFLSTFLLFVPS
jgi:hypothetical protein